MTAEAGFTYFAEPCSAEPCSAEPRPAVMVVSHERSGTHFLMNALAACYGYVNVPWIDLDRPPGQRFKPLEGCEIRDVLLAAASRPMANIVKSHHTADFYAGDLARLTERYVLFAMCRDPVAVMLSYWRYLYRFTPEENAGPRAADPVTFARAAPFGLMTRYQAHSCGSVIERWAAHVESWRTAAEACPRVRLVRFEDLDTRYADTMQSFGSLLGRSPRALIRPARDNVLPVDERDPLSTGIVPDMAALRRVCRETVGDSMTRLSY
jgi:hypothetical protein